MNNTNIIILEDEKDIITIAPKSQRYQLKI